MLYACIQALHIAALRRGQIDRPADRTASILRMRRRRHRRKARRVIVRRHIHRQRLRRRIAMTVLNGIGKRIVHRGVVLHSLHRTFVHTVAVAAIRIQRQRAITARQRLRRARARHHTQRLAARRGQIDRPAGRTASILRMRMIRFTYKSRSKIDRNI